MATNTYVALDKVTTSGSATSVTFSSIPSTYTDLVIVVNGSVAGADRGWLTMQAVSYTHLTLPTIYSV